MHTASSTPEPPARTPGAGRGLGACVIRSGDVRPGQLLLYAGTFALQLNPKEHQRRAHAHARTRPGLLSRKTTMGDQRSPARRLGTRELTGMGPPPRSALTVIDAHLSRSPCSARLSWCWIVATVSPHATVGAEHESR
jgi:hypothetical protein